MRTPDTLDAYRAALVRWLPGVRIERGRGTGLIRARWRGPAGLVDLGLHHLPHLATRDIHLVVNRLRAGERRGPAPRARCVLLAPYVRRQQAEVLEQAGIDYLDLAGNAHVDLPGVRVHVEGKRLARAPDTPLAMTPGWVRFVLALLVRPELAQARYREVAAAAGIALGAVPRYRQDLERRGFLLGRRGGSRLARREDLLATWVHGYATTLRPRLKEQRFRTPAALRPGLGERLRTVLAARAIRWTLTGAAGAAAVDHYLETADLRVYAPRDAWTPDMLRELRLQPAMSDADLVAIEAPGPLALEAILAAGRPCAPLALVYAELRWTDTGQAREAADRLLPRLLEDRA